MFIAALGEWREGALAGLHGLDSGYARAPGDPASSRRGSLAGHAQISHARQRPQNPSALPHSLLDELLVCTDP